MTNKIDRRIIKSQKAIQSTFLSMLIKDGFDEITVKKITEQADISRKTFYLHYLDKYDLLDTIVNKKLEELEEICEQKKEKGFIDGTVIWFNYFDENKDFFSALFSSKSTVSFRKQLLDFMMNQLSKKINNISAGKDPEILLRFLSMAVLGILESFILNELNSSTEEIAKQVGELLLQNISLSSH
ncbi:bacterial regulatory s, tetR family protein [Clostridium baratii str. Sullivan]|uniref:Bacterial regulatory s, tetR family protein n=1 Tax=Clostridium baratii str. Sullivan TaxID=1415775 RepID=A0A0A7FWU4_9CLOT|nr:TetR/AcrR family transcriptional regulator C-terminal domain-containing protein [Clostridium baratii]AIY83380.1 bacterial regulatory s, tetR family protein [Clostridium baratii str. Sullivan]